MLGGRGNDSLTGRAGRDILVGQPGQDILFGEPGNDVVYGGPGDDVLYGGLDQDRFVIRRGEGIDLIRDFVPGGNVIVRDQIVLSRPLGYNSLGFRDVTVRAQPNGTIVGTRQDGTSFQFPAYPSLGPSGSIVGSSGTEIFIATRMGVFEGQTLAYVEGVSASVFQDRALFDTTSDIVLPSPIQ